jgi:hypothetical protein
MVRTRAAAAAAAALPPLPAPPPLPLTDAELRAFFFGGAPGETLAALCRALDAAGLPHDAFVQRFTWRLPTSFAAAGQLTCGSILHTAVLVGAVDAVAAALALRSTPLAAADDVPLVVATASLHGRVDVLTVLLDAGVRLQPIPELDYLPHDEQLLCFAALAPLPLWARPASAQRPTSEPAAVVAALRGVCAALLARDGVTDARMHLGVLGVPEGVRLSSLTARRGFWDRAVLIAWRGNSGAAARNEARLAVLALAVSLAALAPAAVLLAHASRWCLTSHSARRRRRRASLLISATRTLQEVCTRPRVPHAPHAERPHLLALLLHTAVGVAAGAAADDGLRALRLAAAAPPLQDFRDDLSDADEAYGLLDGSDSDSEEELPPPTAATLFPGAAMPHDAACASVLRNFAASVPLRWSPAAHRAYPEAFRRAARATALSLARRELPAALRECIVARLAELAVWPDLLWGAAAGAARYIHTPPPASLAALAAQHGEPLLIAV